MWSLHIVDWCDLSYSVRYAYTDIIDETIEVLACTCGMSDISMYMKSLHSHLIYDTTWSTASTESNSILEYVDPVLASHHDDRIFELPHLSGRWRIYFEVAHHRDPDSTEIVRICV